MVNFVSKISFFSCLSFLVFFSRGKVILRNLKSYRDFSYTTYKPWNLQGEMNFVFKTIQANAFLAYQDDGQHNFIEIFLYESGIRLKTGIGDCVIQEVFVKQNVNDLYWHRVRVTSEANNFTISVDDTTVKLPCSSAENRRNMRAGGNYLYVANFSPMTALNLNLLAFPGTFHDASSFPSFEGCIGDLWVTDIRGKLMLAEEQETKSTETGCNSSCSTPHLNKCQHEGKCVDAIGHVECQCLGSGYEGAFCSEPSASIWFNASGFILFDVGIYHPGRSTSNNDIAFRFSTTNPSGVVMFTDLADDHVIVELTDGFLRVSWDLGQGSLVLMSREGCLHDGTWHMVTMKREKRRIKITVDDQRHIYAVIPGSYKFLDFKGGREMMFFGGGPTTKAFNRSLSKTNFTGFLQHLYFDEFDVINETIHGQSFSLIGDAVFNASTSFHLTITSPPPLRDCLRKTNHNSEYLCEENDDEDLCGETAASGEGLDHLGCDSINGDCSSPDVQEITGGPSVVRIPPVNHTSLVSMTSHMQPSPSRTVYAEMTKYINESAVVKKTQEMFFKSSSDTRSSSKNESILIIKPTNTMDESIKRFTVQKSPKMKPRNFTGVLASLTPSAVPTYRRFKFTTAASESSIVGMNNEAYMGTTSFESSRAVNGSLAIILKYSASGIIPYENTNMSALKGSADEATGNPTWVLGIFVVSLLLQFHR